jgi:hypothetical protein
MATGSTGRQAQLGASVKAPACRLIYPDDNYDGTIKYYGYEKSPSRYSELTNIDSFLKSFPGAQAYYVSKSFSESILDSNTIVYLFNPYNPTDTNGTRLANENGQPFFNGDYPLTIVPNKNKRVYGADVLNQYKENIDTYIKDGYTLFDAVPYYGTSPVELFKFSILARKVPNGTWIN